MKKCCLIILCLLSTFLQCSAIDISAASAILYEPETNSILFEKNIYQKRDIASTTKLMTAVVVLENTDLSDIVTVPRSCVGVEGTSMYLKEGEKLTVSDLLYGLLLQSGNDAANTLAFHVGQGNISSFVELMNKTAQKIGLRDTSFKNPSGLPAEEHYSTAFDMAKLADYALDVDGFSEIVSTKSITVAGRTIVNHNKLLRTYNGANGFKTGFTKAAGRCLVSGAVRDGMQLIAVTLSAPDDWNDHRKLFDFGFENFSLHDENKNSLSNQKLSVVGGESSEIFVELTDDFSALTSKEDKIERIVFLPRFIYAPVKQGDTVGKIVYYKNGVQLKTLPLISTENVNEYIKPSLFKRIFKAMSKM